MFYVLDENNNKIPALDTEGVFAAIEKAIADGSLADLVADSAFVTKLRCCVSGRTNKIAFVTEAKYNEMVAAGTVESGVYYYITDDTSIDTIDAVLKALDDAIVAAENRITAIEDGATKVPKAAKADNATNASYAVSAGSATKATNATNASNASNAAKVNNLEIKQDENGVLKIGDIIIPQKKLLWSGELSATTTEQTITVSTPLTNKKIEVLFSDGSGAKKYEKYLMGTGTACYATCDYHMNDSSGNYDGLRINGRAGTTSVIISTILKSHKLYAIYEIIE